MNDSIKETYEVIEASSLLHSSLYSVASGWLIFNDAPWISMRLYSLHH
jgi:hypothetical protein